MSHALAQRGFDVTGVDPSTDGIEQACANFPDCRFALGSAYDDLAALHGVFDAVVSLEVVEHVFHPRRYARTVASLLAPGGVAIISTPYHSYTKNLVLALLNRWDAHLDPLWDYGHIKLWSRPTLRMLFEEAGLSEIAFERVGRIPPLAKSMIAAFGRRTDR